MPRSRVVFWAGGIVMLAMSGCRSEPRSNTIEPPPSTEPNEPKPKQNPSGEASQPEPVSANEQPPAEGLASVVGEQVEAARAEEQRSDAETQAAPGEKPGSEPQRFPPPTEAEFEAWNRKDPESEKRLYKWDRDNLDSMLDYYADLECFRHQVMTAGKSYIEGKSSEEEWFRYKRKAIPDIGGWLTQMFADHPRIMEKSKIFGNLLELHELVSRNYPRAYNEKDQLEIDKSNAVFAVIEAKVSKYVTTLGGTLTATTVLECAARSKKKKAKK